MAVVDGWPAWPSFGLRDDIRPALGEARHRSIPVAVVTLFHSAGGSPRGVGAQMVVGDGILSGHVSGGCVESDVANHGRSVIASGVSKRLVYGKGGPWDLPLPCGGRIDLLIEAVRPHDPALAAVLNYAAQREPCVWVSDGDSRQCIPAQEAHFPVEAEAGVVDVRIYRYFAPRTRIIVFGSDPNALAIAGLAAAIDMETVLVSPNGPREPPPLAGVTYLTQQPDEALRMIGIDRWTAIATCTHDHDLDQEALVAALRSDAFFVGALGSERRRTERLAALRASDVGEGDLARLRTPIGLPIGARAPWEIGVATLAEVVAKARETLPRTQRSGS